MGKTRGWRKIAVARNSGEKVNLTTLDGYWIVPKKLSLDVFEQITDAQKLNINPDLLKGKTDEEIKEIIESHVNSNKADFNIADEGFQKMTKLSFLNGVYEHNFDTYVDKEGKEIDQLTLDSLSDKDFNDKIKSGEIKQVIIKWDEDFYKKMREFMDTLFEIYKIVMEFNSPLASKTSEKSETSQNGYSGELNTK